MEGLGMSDMEVEQDRNLTTKRKADETDDETNAGPSAKRSRTEIPRDVPTEPTAEQPASNPGNVNEDDETDGPLQELISDFGEVPYIVKPDAASKASQEEVGKRVAICREKDGFSLVAEHVSRKAVVFGGTQSTDTNSTGSSSANGSEPTGAVAALSKTEPVAGDEGLTRLVVLDVLPPGWRPGKSELIMLSEYSYRSRLALADERERQEYGTYNKLVRLVVRQLTPPPAGRYIMIELTQDQGQEIPEIKAGMSITVDPGVLTVSESGKAVVGVDNIRLVNAIPEHLEMSRVFAQECFHPLEKLLVPGASPGYVYVHTIGRIEEVGSYIRHRGQHIMLSDGKSNNQLKIIFTLNSLYDMGLVNVLLEGSVVLVEYLGWSTELLTKSTAYVTPATRFTVLQHTLEPYVNEAYLKIKKGGMPKQEAADFGIQQLNI